MRPANDNARPRGAREVLSEALHFARCAGEWAICDAIVDQLDTLGGPVAFARVIPRAELEDTALALASALAEAHALGAAPLTLALSGDAAGLERVLADAAHLAEALPPGDTGPLGLLLRKARDRYRDAHRVALNVGEAAARDRLAADLVRVVAARALTPDEVESVTAYLDRRANVRAAETMARADLVDVQERHTDPFFPDRDEAEGGAR